MKKLFFIFICSITLLSACNNPADSPYPDIQFEKRASMPFGRSSAVSFVLKGKAYIALGKLSINGNYLNDCWEYNPASNNWLERDTFPGTRRVKAIADTCNGNVYIGLGFSGEGVYQNKGYLNDFWMYNPTTNLWIKKDSFPGKSTDACVSFTYDNCIYVGSGFNGWGFTSDFWKFDTQTEKWSQLNNFPGSPRFGAVLCHSDEHIYFGTGYRTVSENDWWEYFPENDSWKKLKSMPDNGRVNATALAIGKRFFVSSGKHFAGTLTGGLPKSDILEYDAIRNVWYERGNIPNGNRENAVSFVINGRGYIGLGENENTVLSDLWSFEP